MVETIESRLWLSTANEYLNAVQVLIDHESSRNFENPNTFPIFVLLAYTFEHIFKVERQIVVGGFDKGHDLEVLWKESKSSLASVVDEAKSKFVERAISEFSVEYRNVAHSIGPNHGQPSRCFEDNLGLLSKLTAKPFQSRYPKVAIREEVETRFLLCVARHFHRVLESRVAA